VRAVPSQRGVRAIHLRPSAELAERVLLPGDPRRALVVAQSLLDAPRMFNHNRGLWGYTGGAPDGEALTIQATGMGGPSAAIVCEELIALGARRLVRIGTCGALGADLRLGDLLAAEAVVPADGTSAALGADSLVRPDRDLTAAMVDAGARPATVVSTDLVYDHRDGPARDWVERGASAVEMEAAAVLSVAARHGVAAACALAVSDVHDEDGTHHRIADAELEDLAPRLGELGYEALRTRKP
jgi:uridine phosphorylase